MPNAKDKKMIHEAKVRTIQNTSVVIMRSLLQAMNKQIQNSSQSCVYLNVRFSLVLNNMLSYIKPRTVAQTCTM